MKARRVLRGIACWLAVGAGLVAAGYAMQVGRTWLHYGNPRPAANVEGRDALLDRFMPVYDVVERHQVRVAAPAEFTYAAACEMDLEQSAVIRAIFKARAWVMRSAPTAAPHERDSFVAQLRALGWGVLAEIPGREIVMGGVTQPWKANPVFRALSPEEFAAFREPDTVKIIWTLRADPGGPAASVFRTETRAVATDPSARTKFRLYWSFVSPGVSLIRWMSLGPLKADAERRAREAETVPGRAAVQGT